MIPAIPIGVFTLAFLLAVWLGMAQRWRLLLALLLVLGAVFIFAGNAPVGPDGLRDIRYAMVAYLGCIPGAAGLMGGALLGWLILRARRRSKAE